MRVIARLPDNRWQEGVLWLMDGDRVALGPFRCRGKADNAAAAQHGNPPVGSPSRRDPRKPYGDTPHGFWANCRIVVREHHQNGDGIGAVWIPLPFECAADAATKALLDPALPGFRDNLGIHAGRGDGRLVATHGCLRIEQAGMTALVHQLGVGSEKFTVEITGEAS